VAARYGITSIPAAHEFQGGEIVATSIGAKPKQVLEQEFGQFLT
jgi:thioredoxin 1